MSQGIQEYFERFGDVEAVRVHSKNGNHHYGFVQFKMEECAKRALSMKSHRIGNCFVKVKAADKWHQPVARQEDHWHESDEDEGPQDLLLVPPEEDSAQQILNILNDDCLRVVFKFFELNDLCNTAMVCVRFQQHAIDAFSLKYRNLSMFEFDSPNKDQVESLFKNFGPLINSVEADSYHVKYICEQNDFLSKMQTKCVNLMELKLISFSELKPEYHSLFAKLQRLSLEYCELGDGMEDLFGVCEQLRTLNVKACETENAAFINQTFPMLEEAKFDDLDDVYNDELRGFIRSNPTLTKLKINGFHTFPTEFLSTIGQHLPNLTQLEIVDVNFEGENDFQRDIVFLGQLHSLEVLKIELCYFSITQLVTSLVTNQTPIQHLELINGVTDNKAIEDLSQLKRIKMLNLSNINNLKSEHLIDLAKELPELNELLLCEISDDFDTIAMKKVVANAKKLSKLKLESVYGIEIDVDDFKAMLKSVQSRAERAKLIIKIISDGDRVDVPEEIMNANREWLYIDEHVSIGDNDMISNDSNYDDLDDWMDDDRDGYDLWDCDSYADSEEGYMINGQLFFLG